MSTPSGTSRLVVMSGPSGSGKSTIIERLRAHPRVQVSVSVTTRPPRADEVEGRDYHFVDRATFEAWHAEGRFVETNDVFGNGHLYGSLRSELERALARPGTVYLMEVDIRGARNLRHEGYEGLYVFVAPPSMAELEARLRGRGTDDDEQIEARLRRAREEIEEAEADDATRIVVNDDLDRVLAELAGLMGLDETRTTTT